MPQQACRNYIAHGLCIVHYTLNSDLLMKSPLSSSSVLASTLLYDFCIPSAFRITFFLSPAISLFLPPYAIYSHNYHVRFNSVGLQNFCRSFDVLVCTWILTCIPPWLPFCTPSHTLGALLRLVNDHLSCSCILFVTVFRLTCLRMPLNALRNLLCLSVFVNKYLSLCSLICLYSVLTHFWRAFIGWILLEIALNGAKLIDNIAIFGRR